MEQGAGSNRTARRLRPVLIACICLTAVALAVVGYRIGSLKCPVCALIQSRPGYDLKGLDKADIVYEWHGRDGDLQMPAVFTRQFKGEAGPLGVLGIGAAHGYGATVCAGGYRAGVSWVRKGLMEARIAFEYPGASGADGIVRFPPGRVWIHITASGRK